MNFVQYLAAISMTHIVVGSSIFGPVRKIVFQSEKRLMKLIAELISCHQCSGFWIGSIVSMLFAVIDHGYINLRIVAESFMICGPVVSLFADLFYRFKHWLCERCG